MHENEAHISDMELAKLQIEQHKLDIERKKLHVEQYKARWSAFAVAIPLLVVAVTLGVGVWNQNQQNRLAFALKAAEIIMATDKPNVTHEKAIALLMLFPGQLPPNFAKSFNPNSVGSIDVNTPRRELLRLMASKPESAIEILRIWTAAYP